MNAIAKIAAEIEHTPGPWFANFHGGWSVRHSGHGAEMPLGGVAYPIDEEGNASSAISRSRAGANARLMAAAPDMLAALKLVERDRANCNGQVLEMHASAIRAAIVKAEIA